MSIRAALLAALCLSAAGCTTPTPNLSGAFASLRTEDPPARTCRNVASEAVALSGRASLAAGIPVRDPRVGEAGVTEVAWPLPKAEPGSPESDPALAAEMTRLQAEAETTGCAIAFRESLPPSASEIAAAAPPPVVDPVVRPGTSRSAWNAPATPVAPGARVAAAAAPTRAAVVAPAVPAAPANAGIAASNPGVAAKPAPKPAPKPVALAAPQAGTAEPLVIVPAAKPAPKPAPAVDQAPRQAVRSIPITPAAVPQSQQ